MTAEQLEELRKLAALPPDSPTSKSLASLARKVIAAEKLVEASDRMFEDATLADVVALQLAITSYREASK